MTGPTGDWAVGLCGSALMVGIGLVICRACLKRELERLLRIWDDIYYRLVQRCRLVAELSIFLRRHLKTNPRVADDIEYLLKRMEETNDPYSHAAVQNGLVLTVQTAVEQFHRDEGISADKEISGLMERIGAIDSGLITMRDKFNNTVTRYNRLINTIPLSLLAWLSRTQERQLFPMLIPWWSTDPAAYGKVSSGDIRQTLQTSHAPLVLAPSQRSDWNGGASVLQVPKRPGRPGLSPHGSEGPAATKGST